MTAAPPESSDDEFVLLKGFETLVEAQVAVTRLESEDIPSLIPGENIIRINPHLPNPGGVKVLVKRGDLMRARALLEPAEPFEDEDEESTAHAGELQCLKCGATSVEEDHGAYKRSILISIFAAIAASLPFPPRRAYRCRSCGYRWRARVR